MADLLERLKAALADRYAIEREIGAGGMATVYLAEDLKHHRKVAVKVLRPELAASLGAERFLREIEIAANLTHPHILGLFDSGEADGFLFYVMPYIEGETLRDRMNREGQLPLDDALQITREVAAALSYAHSHDVIHRDIKPENVLLSAGEAVVVDFGIARAITEAVGEHLTETGISIGTPAYMSPEQATGDQKLDGRSDVYSLGCVLYEMLAGEPPYTGPNAQAIVAKKLSEPVPSLRVVRETVPAEIQHVVTKALAKSPADRFRTAAEFAEALARPVGTVTPSTQPVQATGRRLGTAHKVRMAVAALAIVVVAGTILMPERGAALIPNRILVAKLDNETGDASLDDVGKIVADWVARDLQQIQGVEVIDPRAALGSAPAGLATAEDWTSVQAMAERLGAGTIVSGSYYRQGDSLRFQMRITETRTGRLLDALDPAAAGVDDPLEGIEAVGGQVAGAIVSRFAPQFAPLAATFNHPKNYAAYREYVASLELFSRRDFASARRSAYRALALDSTFHVAAILAVAVHFNLGQLNLVDSITASLGEHRDQLTELERHLVDAWASEIRGDRLGAFEAFRKAYDLAPMAPEIAVLAGAWAQWSNHPRAAVEILTSVDPQQGFLRNYPAYWSWLSTPLHMLGEYDRELDAARRGRQQFSDRHPPLWIEMRALAAMGRVDEIVRVVDESAALRPEVNNSIGEFFRRAAWELRAHGYAKEADEMLERAIAWFGALPPDEAGHPTHRLYFAMALYGAERWAEAGELFSGLRVEQLDNVAHLGHLGVIAARQNDPEEASRISEQLAAIDRPYIRGQHTRWRACIAAGLGDRDEAVALLRTAFGQGVAYELWIHTDPALESLRDYPPFQELTRPKG